MNAAAILMMIVTILLVWGGLVASVVLLKFLPASGDETMSETPETPSTE